MSFPGGYLYRPSRYSPPLGHAGLDIELTDPPGHPPGCIRCASFYVVASRPMERSFHSLKEEDGESESVRVCAGGFRLRAGDGDIIHGFSFGGMVHICEEDHLTICRLESPAPVFGVERDADVTREFLYAEFLAMLARRRAAWSDDAAFARKLAAADPFRLFVAMLVTLESYLQRFGGSWGLVEYEEARRAVRRAISTLQAAGEWPLDPPGLAALL